MLDLIKDPWPWWVAGPVIGLAVPVLLLMGNRAFGISSSLRHICAACIPANIPFFNYDWRKESWNLFFVGGALIGAVIAFQFMSSGAPVAINESTHDHLAAQGIRDFSGLMPGDVFAWSQLSTARGLVFMVLGGFLVGFGTRYAGGCTSGHAIMGISTLQWPSLLSTCCFMGAGVLMTWYVIPGSFTSDAPVMETLKEQEVNTDFEVRSLDANAEEARPESALGKMKYAIAGIAFGIVLVKAEVISWFRIQEMFRFESFHMYGVIGAAIVVGIISVQIIKRTKARTIAGEAITFTPKPFSKGLIFGGLLFGMGWAITGACPGPLYVQIGAGFPVIIVTLLSAIAGTWVYGYLRDRLPH